MKEVRKEKRKEIKKYLLGMVGLFGVLLVIVGTIYNSYAYLESIRSISFSSSKLDYSKKEPGSGRSKRVLNGLVRIRRELPFL